MGRSAPHVQPVPYRPDLSLRQNAGEMVDIVTRRSPAHSAQKSGQTPLGVV